MRVYTVDQLRPRYGVDQDTDPGDTSAPSSLTQVPDSPQTDQDVVVPPSVHQRPNPRMPPGKQYGPCNPRRSKRISKPPQRWGYE